MLMVLPMLLLRPGNVTAKPALLTPLPATACLVVFCGLFFWGAAFAFFFAAAFGFFFAAAFAFFFAAGFFFAAFAALFFFFFAAIRITPPLPRCRPRRARRHLPRHLRRCRP